MITIGGYQVDPRTGFVSKRKPSEKTSDEIFREVKLRRSDLIRAHSITDQELKALIEKIKSGTRNVIYLAVGKDYSRLKDIAAYIVREYKLS